MGACYICWSLEIDNSEMASCKTIEYMTLPRRALSVPLLLLGGCASAPLETPPASQVDRVLQAVGLQRPAGLDAATKALAPKPSRQLVLRLHAGEVLNVDGSGRSLALVARIYTLRKTDAFLAAPPDVFEQAHTASTLPSALANDVIGYRELTLTPGHKHETLEKLPEEATAIAVVGLFRKPDAKRWRFVFDAHAALQTGITLGAHGCAWSVAQGQALHVAPEYLRVAGVRCQP